MIWALLAGAPAPLHVARTTCPHPRPIVSGGCMGMPARQREIQTLGLPSAARDGVRTTYPVAVQTCAIREKYRRAHAASKHDRSQSAEKVVDQEWGRRTSISSAWARLLDILFVGGHEAISPVRCAPPSPVLRPRSCISRCFCSFAAPRARLCQPLPIHARASDGARAGKKGAPDPELHAAAARAAIRARQRRRGRLGRRRLGPLLRRLTDGQLSGRVIPRC